MKLTNAEQAILEQSTEFARRNKKSIARRLTDRSTYPPESHPVSVFMAGSPGAGKTEASKALIQDFGNDILRIDPDDLRQEFEGYSGDNSWLFQASISILVEKITTWHSNNSRASYWTVHSPISQKRNKILTDH